MAPRISVVCVTNRKGAAAYLKEQLDKQTFQDFEVIVADDSGDKQYVEWKHFVPRQKKPGDVWNFCKAYNDCLNLVQGELVVFIQDFIHIQANALERFWEVYQLYPDALITGPGNKALEGITGISELDYRTVGEPGLSPADSSQFELNFGSCPTKLLIPFNEAMDDCYAGAEKLWTRDIGAPVYIDRSNQCIGLSQEFCGGRPKNWETKHFLKSKWNRI